MKLRLRDKSRTCPPPLVTRPVCALFSRPDHTTPEALFLRSLSGRRPQRRGFYKERRLLRRRRGRQRGGRRRGHGRVSVHGASTSHVRGAFEGEDQADPACVLFLHFLAEEQVSKGLNLAGKGPQSEWPVVAKTTSCLNFSDRMLQRLNGIQASAMYETIVLIRTYIL